MRRQTNWPYVDTQRHTRGTGVRQIHRENTTIEKLREREREGEGDKQIHAQKYTDTDIYT